MSPQTLFRFAYPYEDIETISPGWIPATQPKGDALVWYVTADALYRNELEYVIARPRGLSLVIVLPPPSAIAEIASSIPYLSAAQPHAVLPAGKLSEPGNLRLALAMPPRGLASQVAEYLTRHGIVQSREARAEIKRIFELAPKTPTISRLCRAMYTSRRTLGRHFEANSLPVPSHWLQFARLLHVIMRAHAERTAIFRLAVSAGYPDGFTLSNQMKRLIGYRPTEIRGLYGFEWVVEEWLKRERTGLT